MKKNETNEIVRDSKRRSEPSRLIAKSFIITLAIVFFVFGFLVSSLVALIPSRTGMLFDEMGLSRAAYTAHKRVFVHDGSNENLYNVLQYAIKQKDYIGVENYSVQMLSRKDFLNFASSVDGATREALGDSYYVLLGEYETYVKCSLTRAYYKNGKKADAKLLALASFDSQADELGEYIACVNSDSSLSDLQKMTEIASFYYNYNNIYIKLDSIIAHEYLFILDDADDFSQAVAMRKVLSAMESKYHILFAVDRKSDASAIQTSIVNLQAQLTKLVEKL